MGFLTPDHVYIYALRAIPKVTGKYPVANQVEFAQVLTGLSFQESCIRKTTKDYACFDTEARPLDKKGNPISSALGLTQVLKGTQRNIERLMKWPARSLDDRKNPQYAMELAAAYLAYLYNGGDKTPKGDWYKALVAYHDGHYSKKGAGHAYAKLVLKHLKLFDFAAIVKRAGASVAMLQYNNRGEFR